MKGEYFRKPDAKGLWHISQENDRKPVTRYHFLKGDYTIPARIRALCGLIELQRPKAEITTQQPDLGYLCASCRKAAAAAKLQL